MPFVLEDTKEELGKPSFEIEVRPLTEGTLRELQQRLGYRSSEGQVAIPGGIVRWTQVKLPVPSFYHVHHSLPFQTPLTPLIRNDRGQVEGFVAYGLNCNTCAKVQSRARKTGAKVVSILGHLYEETQETKSWIESSYPKKDVLDFLLSTILRRNNEIADHWVHDVVLHSKEKFDSIMIFPTMKVLAQDFAWEEVIPALALLINDRKDVFVEEAKNVNLPGLKYLWRNLHKSMPFSTKRNVTKTELRTQFVPTIMIPGTLAYLYRVNTSSYAVLFRRIVDWTNPYCVEHSFGDSVSEFMIKKPPLLSNGREVKAYSTYNFYVQKYTFTYLSVLAILVILQVSSLLVDNPNFFAVDDTTMKQMERNVFTSLTAAGLLQDSWLYEELTGRGSRIPRTLTFMPKS